MEDDTIRAYEAISELYDAQTKDFWEQFPKRIFSEFCSLLKGNRVLDLGSGPGRDAEYLRDLGMDVSCVDGAESMIHITEKKGFNSILKDLRSEDIQFYNYNGVWAYSSFIHITIPEAKKVLERISHSMKEGSILFLGLIEGNGYESLSVSGSEFIRMFQYYTRETIEEIITGTGFRLLKIEEFKPKNHNYLNCFFNLVN